MKRISLSILSFCCLISSAFAQTAKEEIFNNLNKSGGVYYAYPYTTTSTATPKGYQPFYVSHFGRHGSRYLINDGEYRKLIKLLEEAKAEKSLSALGEDLLVRLKNVFIETELRNGDLSSLGVKQQKDIAHRLYNAYPSIFTNGTNVTATATVVGRCILSMSAFCEGLKECNPSLNVTRDSGDKFMPNLNYHSQESQEFASENGPWREEYRKFEEANINGERLAKSLFTDNSFILKKVNPTDLIWSFYWVAVDMQNIETKADFFDIFEKEELYNLWQTFNYRFYVCNANYKGNNGMALANTSRALRNIIETADEVIQNDSKGATLRFAHDGNLIPLAGLMRIENCFNSVDDPYEFPNNFVDFRISPMAGNIQLIFFRKNDNKKDVLVKILLNEKEVKLALPTDNFPFYKWDDLKKFYSEVMNEYTK